MSQRNNAATVELRNGRMLLAIDTTTGAISRIEDTETGLVHVDATRDGREDGRLFRLIVPSEGWWACYADSHEQCGVTCKQTGDTVTVEYPELRAADGAMTGIRAVVEITPDDVPDGFRFVLKIENRGPRTIIDVAFPLVGGWHDGEGDPSVVLGASILTEARSLALPTGNNYARNGRRKGWQYPCELACPWVDVSHATGGLSYINQMTESKNGRFCMENLGGYGDDFRLMFAWSQYCAIRPGSSWTSPPMVLAVHGSDRYATAERYRAWFDSVYPPDYSRPGIRSRIGFQNVFFRGFDGTPVNPLEQIPDAAAAGRECGVDVLCVWDTPTLGNYSRHDPHDLTDYPAEESEVLRRGLRQAEAEGSKTCALVNFRHPNVVLHLPDPDLPNRIQRR